jgi:hypothetical protein
VTPVDPAAARRTGAIEAVERILNREGEADAILRATVAVLAERFGCFVGVRFVEDDSEVLGPAAGPPGPIATEIPVQYRGTTVAEIVTDAALDRRDRDAFSRIATIVSPYCLVGWDTGGVDWDAPENWHRNR